jgi:hypothetical protein
MAHPVPGAEYGDGSGTSVGTPDEKRVAVENGQGEAPQALQSFCCHEVAGQKKNIEVIDRTKSVRYSEL